MKHRFAAWLAILAMTLNASWPLLVYAKPKAFELPLELCSVTGAPMESDGNGATGPASPHSESGPLHHCAVCSAGGQWTASPRLQRPLAALSNPARDAFPPIVAQRGERHVYHPARPRAPPVVS